eukprot:scaffold92360_cov28-Tisochrysis_lutea.AAC.4
MRGLPHGSHGQQTGASAPCKWGTTVEAAFESGTALAAGSALDEDDGSHEVRNSGWAFGDPSVEPVLAYGNDAPFAWAPDKDVDLAALAEPPSLASRAAADDQFGGLDVFGSCNSAGGSASAVPADIFSVPADTFTRQLSDAHVGAALGSIEEDDGGLRLMLEDIAPAYAGSDDELG